jgi:hypothetical protein
MGNNKVYIGYDSREKAADTFTDGNIDGYISEVICYPSDQTTQKTGIITNINSFYNAY